MKIILDDYIPIFLKDSEYDLLNNNDDIFFKKDIDYRSSDDDDVYVINWGENLSGVKHGIIETGFFFDAAHIDTRGLYNFSSFNYSDFYQHVESLDCPITSKELFRQGKIKQKFKQPHENIDWNGVGLVCQYPNDRSVLKAGSKKDYYTFIERAAKFYGKKLFLKLHPINNNEEKDFLWKIVSPYGCEIDRTNTDSFINSEFVLLYNSTILPDLILRNIPVAQYAPGYFWQSGAVSFTNNNIPSNVPFSGAIQDYTIRFCDFLIWKYCFHNKLSISDKTEMVRTFAYSDNMFPLMPQHSYAQYLINQG